MTPAEKRAAIQNGLGGVDLDQAETAVIRQLAIQDTDTALTLARLIQRSRAAETTQAVARVQAKLDTVTGRWDRQTDMERPDVKVRQAWIDGMQDAIDFVLGYDDEAEREADAG